ncbi:MAG: tRNA(Ile)-lysidine synthetase, partial [Afipia sp.]|nr:tRNA(Ile)-lysidine synthetase [Afipia sp.]
NAALEVMTDGAERYLASINGAAAGSFDLAAFTVLSDEIRVRLLMRAIDRAGHEGPAELGKVEALLQAIDRATAGKKPGPGVQLKQTLAGALISIRQGRIYIVPAPPRGRRKAGLS